MNYLVKVKHTDNTMSMQSHFNCQQPDQVWRELINWRKAPMNVVFKAKLPLSSRRATTIKKSITGFMCEDLRLPYKHQRQGMHTYTS